MLEIYPKKASRLCDSSFMYIVTVLYILVINRKNLNVPKQEKVINYGIFRR